MILDKGIYGTATIWALFKGTAGELLDNTNAYINIFGTGTNTLSTGTMTRAGTGLYWFDYNISDKLGKYTAQFIAKEDTIDFINTKDFNVVNNSVNGDVTLYNNPTFTIYNTYADNVTGSTKDPSLMTVTLYGVGTNAISTATMITTGSTGLFKHTLTIGTAGNYTVLFNSYDGTTGTFGGVWQFLSVNGTVAVASAPAQIGTIQFDNGTTGTTAYVSWTPSGADGYCVYRSSMPFTDYTEVGCTTDGTYLDNTVKDQAEYRYYVIGTNVNGRSLPSDIVYGFVYGDRFNYLSNTLTALRTYLQANLADFKDVRIGDEIIFPIQTPCLLLYPEVDNEENISVGYTGQVDKIYNLNLRIYDFKITQAHGTHLNIIAEKVGKVQSYMESIKHYTPYWYVSDLTSTEYGEAVIEEQTLKYADLKYTVKRRVNRTT